MSTHNLGPTRRDEGTEKGLPTKIEYAKKGGQLLCGFGMCRQPAKEMTERMALGLDGEFHKKLVPWCGSC